MKAKREDLVREHEKQLAAQLKSDGYVDNVIHCWCNIQLFQFTLSDQSLKPTRQDQRGIWDLNE